MRKLISLYLTINYYLSFHMQVHDASPDFLGVQLQFLEANLRKFPFWVYGIKQAVLVSLSLNEIDKAYGCIKALQAISPSRAAKLLEAKILMKKNLFERSKKLFSEFSVHSLPLESREDLIAVLLGLDDFSGAKRVLDTIPKEKRTAMQEAMNRYLDQKLVG